MSQSPREYFIEHILSDLQNAQVQALNLPQASRRDTAAVGKLREECEEFLRGKLEELGRLDVHRTAQMWLHNIDEPDDDDDNDRLYEADLDKGAW